MCIWNQGGGGPKKFGHHIPDDVHCTGYTAEMSSSVPLLSINKIKPRIFIVRFIYLVPEYAFGATSAYFGTKC